MAQEEIIRDPSALSPRQKAAIFILAVGQEKAAEIFKRLDPEEVEMLVREISQLGPVSKEVTEAVVREFRNGLLEKRRLIKGGLLTAQKLLTAALGEEKAMELIAKVGGKANESPFDFLKRTEPSQLLNFIQNEHPQTIALILSYLEPEYGASILASLPVDLQIEVTRRITTMDRTPPDIVRDIGRTLENKLSSLFSQGLTTTGGVKTTAELLNFVDRSTEKMILEAMEETEPELVDEVRKLMFVFEDIIHINDRGIQQVLKEVDTKELAVALKGASEPVKEKIFKNMSKRAAEAIKEEMEFMGPVRLKTVEEAQQRIVAIVRRLEEAGEIVISGRGGKEDELVV